MKTPIYLDYNATAPVRPEVIQRMQEILSAPHNPSSMHYWGREAKKHIENARKTIAGVVSAWPDEIIFMSSATEANSTALHMFQEKAVAVSAIEHSSILKAARSATLIPVTPNGVIDVSELETSFQRTAPALLSVMLANNETGVIQPIPEIAALCKKFHVLLHCDAVQGLGKIPVDFGMLGVDMMTITSHKCGGPVGAAALVIRRGLAFSPLLVGGGQEGNRRAGTENVAAIAGFALAAEKALDKHHASQLRFWLDEMEEEILESQKNVRVIGKESPRLPNTSCVVMPGVSNEVQLMNFDLKGFAVSAGSACSSGRIEVSHVLKALRLSEAEATSAIRISAGWATTETEIKAFTEAWRENYRRLARS